MSTFPNSPKILKGGIVLVDPDTGNVLRIIVLQYNPDGLTRTLQAQAIGPEPGDRLEALRLRGPPAETIKLEAEIDATDQLEQPDQNPNTVQFGIHPQLAALETIIYPPSSQLLGNNAQAMALYVGNSSAIAGTSDVRLKEEVEPANLEMCLNTVKKLPVSRWKWADFAGPRYDWHVTGWMADDVEQIWPKAVITSDEEYASRTVKDCKATIMSEALPTLWGAVQRLIEKNEGLEREIVELKEKANGRTH